MFTSHSPARYLLAVIFIAAGTLHFFIPGAYLRLMPQYLPAHKTLVALSGACEILGGLGLLYPATQRSAAWGLIALLIAVFPANLTMVQHPNLFLTIPLWASWLRLPLQLPLIYWAWLYTRS